MENFIEFCTDYKVLFEITSSVATAIAVFIGLVTLLEVRRQRETTYKPQLIIEEFLFELNTSKYPFKIINNGLNEFIGVNTGSEVKLYLNSLNIGFATASNIEFEFGCDIDKYLKIISDYNKKLDNGLTKNDFEKINLQFSKKQGMILVESKSSKSIGSAISTKHLVYSNYLLPATIQPNPLRLEVPSYILFLHQVLFYYQLNSNFELLDDFKFNVKASYLDISNKRHFKNFNLVITLGLKRSDTTKFKINLNLDKKSILTGLKFWNKKPSYIIINYPD